MMRKRVEREELDTPSVEMSDAGTKKPTISSSNENQHFINSPFFSSLSREWLSSNVRWFHKDSATSESCNLK